jgi:hypothetical protein
MLRKWRHLRRAAGGAIGDQALHLKRRARASGDRHHGLAAEGHTAGAALCTTLKDERLRSVPVDALCEISYRLVAV